MKIALGVLAALGAVVAVVYYLNARVIRELKENPGGERAKKVMLITMPSGKTFPVNYLRDPGVVWAAADTRWWKELAGDARDVTLVIQGEWLRGRARAVQDDPSLRAAVFERLRPTAPSFFGVLIEIRLATPRGT